LIETTRVPGYRDHAVSLTKDGRNLLESQAEDRLLDRGAHIERVVLDHELKSEYQRWLHERDKEHDDYDGHPDRT
jgi:hypothetical protein